MRALLERLRAWRRGPASADLRAIEIAGRNGGITRRLPREDHHPYGDFSEATLCRLRGAR